MEQLVILIVIGLISLINWLMQRSAELREKRRQERKAMGVPDGTTFQEEPEEQAPQRNPLDGRTPGDEMRKLMEALGLPVEAEEPQIPQRRLPPPVPETESAPPVFTPRTEFRPSPRKATEVAPSVERRAPHPFLATLHSTEGLRKAIVLREVLGAPKALRS